MKHILILIIILTLILPAAFAKDKNTSGKIYSPRSIAARPMADYRVHDVGNIWSATSNFGNYGDPNSGTTKRPSGDWPAGTQVSYVWEGRFWVGAIVGGSYLVSHADYGNYEFEPTEGTAFLFDQTVTGAKSIQDSYVTYDDKEDIGGHTPMGIKIVQRGMSWSMPEYDDFLAYEYYIINVSGGALNNVVAAWIFDNDVASGDGGDSDQPHIDDLVDYDGYAPTGENPFKYDMVENYDYDGDGELGGYDEWGWPYGRADFRSGAAMNPNYDPEMIIPDGIWDEYQVYVDINGPPILKQNFDISIDYDDDGIPDDTLKYPDGEYLLGWLISRNMSYMYDSDYPASSENDVGERDIAGNDPSQPCCAGFIGGRLLWSDLFTDKFGYEDGYQRSVEDTLLRSYVHQWWNWESDPGSDEEKYLYMIGEHSASIGKKFLVHPFDYLAGAPTFDYRYVSSTGPFNGWADGDTLRLVYIYGVGLGLEGLRDVMDAALYAYYAGSELSSPANPSDFDEDVHWALPAPPPIPTLSYSPGDQVVNLVWDNSAEFAVDPFLNEEDFEGYRVYRSKYNTSQWQLLFACDNVNDSVYVVTAAGDSFKINLPSVYGSYSGDYVNQLGDSITGMYYSDHIFSDRGGMSPWGQEIEGLINGLSYYYVVTAYDWDGNESSYSNYMKTPEGAPLPVRPHSVPPADPNDLSMVKVVPNPYKGTHIGEARYENFIRFTHLPLQCKISIFTLTGDLVVELYNNDADNAEVSWDLISRNEQSVVSGLYLYVVETDKDKKTGKLLIIR
ncbi:T9SS type A sorting domain-containing protein [bacterium]|nr:T9SS type A sorting domain-containing protein [bacterium]